MASDQYEDARRLEPEAGRLDSWKEIAAYLRRDVRTVQRWHRRAGLPVRRHVDPKQRGVFAFQAELEAWANQFRADDDTERRADPTAGPMEEELLPGRRLGAAWWLLAGALLCAVTVLAASAVRRPSAPAVPFRERDWLLVAAFDNHTGNKMLDESLQYALECELSASSFVNVVPRPRVQDVLRLMRRAGDSRMTPELAREVAVRDGNIQAIVVGRADSVEGGYLLTVEVVDPRTGTTLRTRAEQVAAQPQLLGHVRQLAVWARSALGERPVTKTADARPPQVTTASLSALQFYAKAEEALAGEHRQAARVLLESAVREDPEFALAHLKLGLVLVNEPDVRAAEPLWKQHMERALALSSHATERERLRIVAIHHMFHRKADEAIAAWEALLRIDPDDWDAAAQLSGLYYRLRRIPEAVRELERAAELRPNDFAMAVAAAQAWTVWAGEPDRARTYVERARALWPAQEVHFSSEVGRANSPPLNAAYAAWMLLFSAYDRWRTGDIAGMLSEVQRVLDTNPLPAPADRDALLRVAIALEMTAGRLKDARELAQRVSQDRFRQLHLAVVADAVDDIPTLRRHMARVPPESEQRGFRFVRAGLYREAEYVIARDMSNQGFRETARGELDLRRGHMSEALAQLQRGVELTRAHTLSERYLGAESLASALERVNRKEDALKVLEAAAADEPRYGGTGPSGAFWLRVLGRLSQTYRDRGRSADADAVAARLRRLLTFADADHPLLIQLQRRAK